MPEFVYDLNTHQWTRFSESESRMMRTVPTEPVVVLLKDTWVDLDLLNLEVTFAKSSVLELLNA